MSAQYSDYQKGKAEVEKGDREGAARYFEKSIHGSGDAASCFELAKIYMEQNSIHGNEKARDLLRQAMWKDEENIEYRLLYADLMKRMNINYSNYYEEILEIDSTNSKAWFELGKLHENEFYEYHNSRKAAGEILLSYDEFAEDDFNQAEFALKKVIKYNPEDYDGNLHLCKLYQEAGMPGEAIPLAEKLANMNPDSLDLFLLLGIIYYDVKNFEECHSAFQKALDLMNDEDRKIFEYKTVITLFNKDERKLADQNNYRQTSEQIKRFWNKRDPIFLTKYNERLLAHYVRVAYSNLKFSVPGKIKGWETDRGESVIRYGRPENWMRLRPQLTLQTDGLSMEAKTDVWKYKDMTLAFTDEFSSGNFRYSIPSLPGNNIRTQYPMDTELFIRGLRNSEPEIYDPDFSAPIIEIPYEILQFKNSEPGDGEKTDIVVNYEMDPALLSASGMDAQPKHDCGLYFLKHGFEMKTEFNKEISERDHIIVRNKKKVIVNSITCPIQPDTGMIAFEIMRHKDHGISTNHLPWIVQKFDTVSLSISDILLGSNIEFKNSGKSYLQRQNLYILPNPSHHFSGTNSLNVYYEIYNLKLDIYSMTNFEQTIRVKPYNNDDNRNILLDLVENIRGIFGSSSDGQSVELRTPYQTGKKDTQVYFGLDMEKYSAGSYKLTIEVTDNLSGKTTGKSQIFYVE